MIIFVILVLERLIPMRQKQKFFRKELFHDLFLMFLIETSIIGAIAFVSKSIENFSFSTITPVALHWPFAVKLLVFALMDQFANYWVHRSFHRIPFLWECHKVHHSLEQMDVFTFYRTHWLFEFTLNVILIIPFAFLGFKDTDFYLFYLMERVFGLLMHANIKVAWPGFLKYVFVSPYFHQFHHHRHHYNTNYSGIFSFYDILFGTFHHPEKKYEFIPGFKGVEDYPKNFFLRQLHPFINYKFLRKFSHSKAKKTNKHS